MAKMQIIDEATQDGAYGFEYRVALLKGTKHHYIQTSGFSWGLDGNVNQGGRETTRQRLTRGGAHFIQARFRLLREADARGGIVCADTQPHTCCDFCFPFTLFDVADDIPANMLT